MQWDVFLGAHKHAYNFVSSFISTPLSLSPPPSILAPLSLYKTAAYIPRLACLFHSELPHPHWDQAWEGIRSAESQMLGLRGEPDSRSSPAKLGLCVTSMIPRSGSRKGSWEARGPSAFHRIQQCLRLSTFQGYLKPNPLGSAPSSATWPSESPLVNPFPLWASASQYTMGGGGRGGLDKITSSWSPS